MTATDRRIGYVIVDYRTPRLAAAAAASIYRHRPQSDVVIVNAEGLGYSQAINRGTRYLTMPHRTSAEHSRPLLAASCQNQPSHAEIIVACNADVEMLEPDESVLELFDGVPQLGVIGPRQIDADDRIVHGGIVAYEDGSDWSVDLRHRCWRWELETDNETDALTRGTFDVPMVAGSVVYVRRAVLDALGGWCERLPFYYEDNLLAFRARWLGWKVVYHGGLTWRHYHESSPIDQEWRHARMRESRQIFVEECGRLGIPLQQPPESGYTP